MVQSVPNCTVQYVILIHFQVKKNVMFLLWKINACEAAVQSTTVRMGTSRKSQKRFQLNQIKVIWWLSKGCRLNQGTKSSLHLGYISKCCPTCRVSFFVSFSKGRRLHINELIFEYVISQERRSFRLKLNCATVWTINLNIFYRFGHIISKG